MNKQSRLSDRLYQLRTERRIPSQDVAKALGVEPPMYSRMERGTRNIKIEHLQKIAEFYQINCTELHSLWVADKLAEFTQDMPDEVLEQAVAIVSIERNTFK
ncbi:helix-turn-helix domain-containing protein [Porphyromonas levii]|uniref:helix-turn-helix domain-containing protein n=1 Tax=Porphyromonas levii TaxID=28114 RepID=UPI001B8DA8D9|nr:helix-turn-helix transcriptional regulator [Porphyromonas levii]MBR8769880.1 hypothetical protein [Porphyromonas levii]